MLFVLGTLTFFTLFDSVFAYCSIEPSSPEIKICKNIPVRDANRIENKPFVDTLSLVCEKNTSVQESILDDFIRLENLDISNCHLENVDRLFLKLFYLRSLIVSHNNISALKDRTFPNVTFVTHFDLSHNNISRIDNNIFGTSPVIQNWNLSNNNITDIAFVEINCAYLVDINLSRNRISILHDKFKNCRFLRHLDLSYNRIRTIGSNSFLSANLKRLNLSHNNLLATDDGAFNGMMGLEYLDLSHNKLTQIPPFSSKPLMLRYLNMASNDIPPHFNVKSILEIFTNVSTVVLDSYLCKDEYINFTETTDENKYGYSNFVNEFGKSCIIFVKSTEDYFKVVIPLWLILSSAFMLMLIIVIIIIVVKRRRRKNTYQCNYK